MARSSALAAALILLLLPMTSHAEHVNCKPGEVAYETVRVGNQDVDLLTTGPGCPGSAPRIAVPHQPVAAVAAVTAVAAPARNWSIDGSGTMRHKPTGMTVSPETGISIPGAEVKLGPQDIEVEIDSRLGAGAGGVVQKGRIKQTGVPVAIKVIRVDDKAKRAQLINEIKGLVQAEGCPYLVQWYAGFANANNNLQVSVALEFMNLGSLADLKKRILMANAGLSGAPSANVAAISAQVTLGLHHLHSKKILHRGISSWRTSSTTTRAGSSSRTSVLRGTWTPPSRSPARLWAP
ncbi:unnamed protein product [Prorocentrum cordatum]|uniref:mitogen-activated protein kinase kinase n=1 Tax=Prorocentrum cordatum TaxID=2364126 RepID=A0ABN9U3C8_9DINO|nr:unnamed protein product [Polarella glacialis]